MHDAVIAAVRDVASNEIMPRFLKAARQRKADGRLSTSADVAAQDALARKLAAIAPCPIVAEAMTHAQQVEQWKNWVRARA